MKDFYTKFYSILAHSQAHHTFCERVYGKDFGQHGFADLEQFDLLIKETGLGPQHHALDVGCGNGLITEYLSDHTGAHITGLDYIPLAIEQAQLRTKAKSDCLEFMVGDINFLNLPRAAYDIIILIDSIYFSDDYTATLRVLKYGLKHGGWLAFFYSYGREPWVPAEQFPKETLPPERTPLAEALRSVGLAFRTIDLTRQDYALALKRKEVLVELKDQFETDGALFIFENRLGDSEGVRQAIEAGLHARYLYLAQP